MKSGFPIDSTPSIALETDFSEAPSATSVKIEGFRFLEPGWNCGGGKPISRVAIELALRLELEAASKWFLQTDAFPGPDGDLMLTLYDGIDYFEFAVGPEGRIVFCHERGDVTIEWTEDLSYEAAVEKIYALWKESWKQSELSNFSSGTPGKIASTVTRSTPQDHRPESRSSNSYASCEAIDASAVISEDFTQESPETPLLIGVSP